jgi:hypothetical protein
MRYLTIFLLFSLSVHAFAQKCLFPDSLHALSEKDLFMLSRIPEFNVNPSFLKATLPPVVDNSTLPYFRPIWSQQDYCCGQAASILYMFTYEIDRLRNLPANVTDNQYPTHFAWNWQNGPDNDRGVSYMNSLELLKFTGSPNVTDWGGTPDFGGGSRWMSGYSKYYNAMLNKVDEYYSISVKTEVGLNVLKNWLHNHCDNSTTGGIACIYIQFTSPSLTLPAGTPEAGKYIITQWGASANHGMVILGYNDSIRWDYNNDGLYTNHIDINSDGIIDMRDREIGGYKVANDFGTGWGNQGYCYVMYKTLAERYGQGGVWNNAVHIVKPKQTYSPLMTYKVTIEHTSRQDITIEAGISQNVTDTIPQYIMESTIVNYQGGDRYMQGGSPSPSTLALEFGLDVTPLLNYVQSGQPARFFFRVKEYDQNTPSNGQITAFSLMDYHSGVTETPYPSLPVSIAHNSVTTLVTDYNPVFIRPVIADDTLPAVTLYEPYSHQLTATGGQPPYKWKMKMNYSEQETLETYPDISANVLNLGNWTSGKAEVTLNFPFPFYNHTYNKMYVHTDGFISFTDENLPWVYYYEESKTTFLKYLKGIAVFITDIEMINPGNGTWIEQYSDSLVIRWNATVPDYLGGHYEVNFAVKLRSDGSISYYYGNCETMGFQWVAGVSNGDYCNWQETRLSNSAYTLNGYRSLILSPGNVNFLNEMTLSETGLISGTITEAYNNFSVFVELTDNQGIKNCKNVYLNSQGLVFDYTVHSGGDSLTEYGEQAVVNMTVRNPHSISVNNVQGTFSSASPYITVTDSLLNIASLGAGQEITIPAAFAFNVSDAMPNEEENNVNFLFESSLMQQNRNENLTGFRPELQVSGYFISGSPYPVLMSGDTATLHIIVKNNSPARLIDATFQLQNINPYITQLSAPIVIDTLNGLATDTLEFLVTVSLSTPWETIVAAGILANARYQFSQLLPHNLYINFNTETFETGDFLSYNWSHNGPQHWYITQPGHTGLHCVRSGAITHSQLSALVIQIETTLDGDISFYRKVDSESNYDYLRFYVDSDLKAEWSGNKAWEKFTFHVPAGLHLFKWIYNKDNTVSTGADCGWVDDIVFPPVNQSNLPFLSFSPASFSHHLPPETVIYDTLRVGNIGGGNIQYRVRTINAQPAPSKSIAGSYITTTLASFHAGDTIVVPLTMFNGSSDSEWLKDAGIVIPQGTILISASPFVGGTGGNMNFIGFSATGDTAKWHGQDGSGWGVVRGGEFASATLTLFIPHNFTGDLNLSYTLYGDIYGALPHTLNGNITIPNLGQQLSWLSYSPADDTLSASEWNDIILEFNSHGLAQGLYTCEIELRGGNSQIFTIPAELRVSYLMFTPDSIHIEVIMDSSTNINVSAYNYFHLPFFVASSVTYPPFSADTTWLQVSPQALMINANTSSNFTFAFDATGLSIGTYTANARFMDQQYVWHEVPVVMTVMPAVSYGYHTSVSQYMLYPNPAFDKLFLLTENNNEYNVRISNSIGHILYTTTRYSKGTGIDVGTWPGGLYFVYITGESKPVTLTFIKE